MRVALAQINPTVGDFRENARLIAANAREAARRGANVVVFPELALTGYPPRDLVEKPSFLGRSESELERLACETADLNLSLVVGFVALSRAETGKRQGRIGSGGDHERYLRRQIVQEEPHCLVDGDLIDDVVVVERDHHRTGEDVEIVDQADQDGLGWRGTGGLQHGERIDASFGFGDLNRGHEVGQEQSEIVVARVESQPRHPSLRPHVLRQPLRQKSGLTEPSRSRHQNQPRRSASVRTQPIGNAGALHQPTTR